MTEALAPEPRQGDLFYCDMEYAVTKGDMGSMEFPIFSLSTNTNKDRRKLKFTRGDNWVEIVPSSIGLANIHDRDVLIFCISQATQALKANRLISNIMRFEATDFLKAVRRNTEGGQNYKNLGNSLKRLTGTRITTNIRNGSVEFEKDFGLLTEYEIIRQAKSGRMMEIQVELPKWIMDAIENQYILTYHPDYFLLRRPLDRRLYELLRKHCGVQSNFQIKCSTLYEKTGSAAKDYEFKRMLVYNINQNLKENYMPDYSIMIIGEKRADPTIHAHPKDELLESHRRSKVEEKRLSNPMNQNLGHKLKPQTVEAAKQYAWHGDVYALASEWALWVETLPNPINNPDGHFISFCKEKLQQHRNLNRSR